MQTIILADLDSLYPNPFQRSVRTGGIDRAHAARLALSMRANYAARPDMRGLFQSLLARPFPDYPNAYQLADGHHRLEAARLLRRGGVVEVDGEPVAFDADPRWGQAPIVVEAISDRDMLLAAVDTALNHKSLGPIDRASAFQALVDQGVTVTEVARRYCLAQSTVSNLVRLLALPEAVRDLVNAGVLPERAGRELLVLARFDGALEGYAARGGEDLWAMRAHWQSLGVTVPGRDDLYLVSLDRIANNVDNALREHATPLRDYTTAWPLAEWNPAHDELVTGEVEALVAGGLWTGSCAACPDKFRRNTAEWCSKPACHAARAGLWQARTARLLEKTAQAQGGPIVRSAGPSPDGAPPPERHPPTYTDSYDRKHKAESKAVNRRRQAFVALASTTPPADLATNVALLQKLDDALNRGNGWGARTTETDPAALWRAILSGVGKHIKESFDLNAETRLAALGDLITALGGSPDPEDLAPIHKSDAELLADLAAALPGRPLGYQLEGLEALADLGAPYLGKTQRAEVLAALSAWAQQPAEGDMAETRARLAAVIALVRPDGAISTEMAETAETTA